MLAEADQRPRAALPGKILVVDDEQRILRFVVQLQFESAGRMQDSRREG